jgi:hypothetical protein
MPPLDYERRLNRRLTNPATGGVACSERMIASPDFTRKIAQRLASLRRLQAAMRRLVGEFWIS